MRHRRRDDADERASRAANRWLVYLAVIAATALIAWVVVIAVGLIR